MSSEGNVTHTRAFIAAASVHVGSRKTFTSLGKSLANIHETGNAKSGNQVCVN